MKNSLEWLAGIARSVIAGKTCQSQLDGAKRRCLRRLNIDATKVELTIANRKAHYDLWLDPGVTDPSQVADLLKPLDARHMRVYPVSSTVNKVGSDGPECAEESRQIKDVEQGGLF